MSAEPIAPLALMGAKLAGAVAGSAISVAYLLPDGRREAAIRFLTGTIVGLVFGGPAGVALARYFRIEGMLSPAELTMAGAAAASLCAWWALGVLARFAEQLFSRGRSRNGGAQ